jgi:CelD/BcsL family acetyltransferase involved in cellulose biosynthesis
VSSGRSVREYAREEVEAADSPWRRAAAASEQADPFSGGPEWQMSFHDAWAPTRRLRLVGDGESFVALAVRSIGTSLRIIEPIESYWCFGASLFGPNSDELLRRVLRQQRSQHALMLGGVPAEGARRGALVCALGSRAYVFFSGQTMLLTADLAGGVDGWLGRRSPRVRRNLRNAFRRAAARGVTFERVTPANAFQASSAYARMLDVERRSWKGIGRCGMAEPPSREFYGTLLRRLAATRSGRAVFARRGSRDIGFMLGGVANGVYRGQQFSFVDDEADASIGNLLQLEQVTWLGEEGVARYDMGPDMAYKRHWAEQTATIDTLLARFL